MSPSLAEATKPAKPAARILGPKCCRCHDVKKVAPFPTSRGPQCFDCFMRPRVIVQIMERLQEQEVVAHA